MFPSPATGATIEEDPFRKLSTEITTLVIDYLSSKDIANLRLCTHSSSTANSPNTLFWRLLLEKMPWMWEARDMDVVAVDWHDFYRTVKPSWTGLKGLRIVRGFGRMQKGLRGGLTSLRVRKQLVTRYLVGDEIIRVKKSTMVLKEV